ncbi:helix-turn-helix domain-containing protein [Lacrimispora sp.]|uniref:helix-turn-helix domain-containing protein n=1 Tax=Lacrimispora sp. TaxID=2719234 RepID=UPI00285A8851|nr:helix-turn-helix domain-containing protein [Lacrimispora sp.]MDR7814957.1 helix-turn-helix domain-containing protein [Lacrimispora sp.]
MVNAAAAKQSLSLRKLSALSGISASSISRIISGKQASNMHHLQQFSKYLDVPIEQICLLDFVKVMLSKLKSNSLAHKAIAS